MELNQHHKRFATQVNLINLDKFFAIVDSLAPGFRDEMLMKAFTALVGVEIDAKQPHDPFTTTVEELMTTAVNYKIFKRKCEELEDKGTSGIFLVQAVVLFALSDAFHRGNDELESWFRSNHAGMIEYSKRKIEETNDPRKTESSKRMIQDSEQFIRELPESMRQARAKYERLCKELVKPLLEAPIR